MKIVTRFFVVLILALAVLLGLGACSTRDDDPGTDDSHTNPACNVTFDYNDGTGRTKTVKVPVGERIADYAPKEIGDCTEIVGWSIEKDGPDYEIAISGDITLYARWQTYELAEYTVETLPNIVNDRFAKLSFSEADVALGGKVLRIGTDARSLSIVSDGTVHTDFSIMIHERVEDFDLSFENFNYKSESDCAFLAAGTGYTVVWQIVGENKIDNSAGQSTTAQRGGDCVRAPSLEISGEGRLTILAGNGKNGIDQGKAADECDGANGTNGQPGGVGVVADRVSVVGVTLNVCGGRGGRGGNGGQANNGGGLTGAKYKNGGNGGNGANGGAAMDVNSFSAKNATLELYGGNGGKGGNGGSDGALNSVFAGRGGNGGNGGIGGSVMAKSISDVSISGTLKTVVPGKGGAGGDGGASHNSSKSGLVGYPARDGASNLPEN